MTAAELPWTWLLLRASGVTAWVLLTAVVCLGLLLRTRVSQAPPLRLQQAHRFCALLACFFLAGHLAFLLVDAAMPFTPWQALVPLAAPWRPWEVALGTLALWSLLPIGTYALLRRRLGRMAPSVFKAAHRVAYAAWPLATAHYALAGSDAAASWSALLLLAAASLLSCLLLARGWYRRPVIARSRQRA